MLCLFKSKVVLSLILCSSVIGLLDVSAKAQNDENGLDEYSVPNSGLLQVPIDESIRLDLGISRNERLFGYSELTDINLSDDDFRSRFNTFIDTVRAKSQQIDLDRIGDFPGYEACYVEPQPGFEIRSILDTLIAKANRDNFDIRQSLETLRVESLDVNVAQSDFIPSLSSSLGQEFVETGNPGEEDDRERSYRINGNIARLDYTFVDGGGRNANLNNAYTARENARRSLIDTVQVVNFNVASTFYNLIEDVLVLNAQIETINNRILTLQAAKQFARRGALHEAELSGQLLKPADLQAIVSGHPDVIRAFRAFQASISDFLNAEESLISQQIILANLVKDDLFPGYQISDSLLNDFFLLQDSENENTLSQVGLFTAPRLELIAESEDLFQPLKIDENEVSIFENLVAVERSTVLPTLTGSAAFTTRNDLFEDSGFDAGYSVSTSINFPFFDGGQTISEVRQARINIDLQESVRDEVELNLRGSVVRAERNFNLSRIAFTSIQALPEDIESEISDDDAFRVAYLAGNAKITDVISAEDSIRQTAIVNAERTLEYLTRLLELQRLTNREVNSPIHVDAEKFLQEDIDIIIEELGCS